MQDLGQNRIEETLQALEELGISGELVRHPAVFTIEEMERLGIALRGEVVKNLFLQRSVNGSAAQNLIEQKMFHAFHLIRRFYGFRGIFIKQIHLMN